MKRPTPARPRRLPRRIPYFAMVYDARDPAAGLVVDISLPDDEREGFLATVRTVAPGATCREVPRGSRGSVAAEK